MKISIRVKVFAGAKKQKFIPPKQEGDVFEIYVREPAQKNLANTRVRELVAEHYGVPLVAAQIITGLHSTKKKLCVIIE